MVICFRSSAPAIWETFHLVLNFSSTLFSLLRVSRAARIFVLKFSMDGLADLGDEFTDGGATNQPVILQGGVGFSCYQVFSVTASFTPTSKGFLKLVTDFLIRWYESYDEVIKTGCILRKFCIIFLSLKYPRHDPGVWWLSSSHGGWLVLWRWLWL